MKKYISIIAVSLLSPLIAFAALNKTGDLISAVGGLVSQLTVIAGGVALLVFIWGLAKFIFKSGDEKSHEEGRAIMTWGVIALFVMVAVWGIVGFMQSALGLPVIPISNTNTVNPNSNTNGSGPGDPCVDALGNPTYIGDCGTF